MKVTDYNRIAPRYDSNPVRHRIAREERIQKILDSGRRRPIRILDLACGTGNYLKTQRRWYRDEQIEWYGHDRSSDMLEIARAKLGEVVLSQGKAVSLSSGP